MVEATPRSGVERGWFKRSRIAVFGKVASVKAAFTVLACTSPESDVKACCAPATLCPITALKTGPEPSACTAFAVEIWFGVVATAAKVPALRVTVPASPPPLEGVFGVFGVFAGGGGAGGGGGDAAAVKLRTTLFPFVVAWGVRKARLFDGVAFAKLPVTPPCAVRIVKVDAVVMPVRSAH